MKTDNAGTFLRAVVLFLGQTHGRIRSSLGRTSCVNAISAALILAACLFTTSVAGATDTVTVIHKFAR